MWESVFYVWFLGVIPGKAQRTICDIRDLNQGTITIVACKANILPSILSLQLLKRPQRAEAIHSLSSTQLVILTVKIVLLLILCESLGISFWGVFIVVGVCFVFCF